MRPTRKDPTNELTCEALMWADMIREWWLVRHAEAMRAYREHGDRGSLISGCEREHFPEPIKERLRGLAREQNNARAFSLRCWRMAGRRRATWRAIIHATGERFAVDYR